MQISRFPLSPRTSQQNSRAPLIRKAAKIVEIDVTSLNKNLPLLETLAINNTNSALTGVDCNGRLIYWCFFAAISNLLVISG